MAGKDRKKELARQRYARQQQQRAQEAAKARRLKIISSAAAVAVIAVGGAVFVVVSRDDESTAAGPKCDYKSAQGPASKDVGKPPAKPAYTGTVQATVKTNSGDVEMQLYGAKAPCAVNSFAHLAQKNYFDKTECHRLTSGGLNVLQCGDPTAKGTGGPGYEFANENTNGATYTEGTLAMANGGPDTNGSQFFLVYKDSQLQPDYTVFGKITKGLDVLKKVADGGSDPKGDGKPKKKVEIQDVTIAGK
ncbi:peptidylprolyl isomerase [Actinomadura soli]|uniref:Peptidyl-prolyl cis-trans isomerase n=1 Tax=Actinomadura soli TaxID=2508997 RepID=A0A5C4J184_9ACTN|nr:peptidylprolyl isomerase [Actinomadura soli]